MVSTATKPVAIKLENDIRNRIARLAATQKNSAHALMKEAILEYVEREEKREAFHQEAMESWKEYKETGLHVTGEEMIEWLNTWGSENEKAAPICHK